MYLLSIPVVEILLQQRSSSKQPEVSECSVGRRRALQAPPAGPSWLRQTTAGYRVPRAGWRLHTVSPFLEQPVNGWAYVRDEDLNLGNLLMDTHLERGKTRAQIQAWLQKPHFSFVSRRGSQRRQSQPQQQTGVWFNVKLLLKMVSVSQC